MSTKFQSLKWQIEALQSYAEQNGCEIEIFSEIVSGAKPLDDCDRQVLCSAIKKAKENELPLVVTALDRLSRRVDVGMRIYEEVPQVISITEGELTREEAREIFAHAEYELNKARMRTSAALQAKKAIIMKAKEAYDLGNIEEAERLVALAETESRIKRGLDWWVARGFRLGSTHKQSQREKDLHAANRAEEAERAEANLRAANAVRVYLKQGGKRGLTAIANYLNENNYRTRRGKGGWSAQTIKDLLKRFDL